MCVGFPEIKKETLIKQSRKAWLFKTFFLILSKHGANGEEQNQFYTCRPVLNFFRIASKHILSKIKLALWFENVACCLFLALVKC